MGEGDRDTLRVLWGANIPSVSLQVKQALGRTRRVGSR